MTEGHRQPCYHCGELCDALAGNPMRWPTMVPAERSARPMHMGCLAGLLRDAARYRWLRDRTHCEITPHSTACADIAWGPAADAMIDAAIARDAIGSLS